jgi:histidinol-phosphate phosphatase family protein
MTFSIVIPTIGRPSLGRLLTSLAACDGPRPSDIVLVDDRREPQPALAPAPGWTASLTRALTSGGRGPAAARNLGWRSLDTTWVAFLDDDVEVSPGWLRKLERDLTESGPRVGASQGRLSVPLPEHRRPTDWERGTYGLTAARWITADMTYRVDALRAVGGFDERFPRAFREDADLALRVTQAGYTITPGTRRTVHPVRPARWNASVAQQRGNADDALMRAVHGRHWHQQAGAESGRRPRHLLTTTSGLLAAAGVVSRRRTVAVSAGLAWAVMTAEFAYARIVPGPRTPREVATMVTTSVMIPPVASWHWLRGLIRHRGAHPWAAGPAAILAVLVDRDGTMVRDVPYNGLPDLVEPLPGVANALARLRASGVRVGVVTNQSGVARGLLTMDQVAAVNGRVEQLLGPFADWQVCPHGEDDGCRCRKPQPGMVTAAARALGVPVNRVAVIGDTGADIQAALSAGAAMSVLVPNDVTRREEIDSAPAVFGTFAAAVEAILAQSRS